MTDERTVKRTYIGIHDKVNVVALDRQVERGETIDVPKSIAGRPPKGKPGDDDYDPGEGLDAQLDNWATPGAAKKAGVKVKATRKRAAKKAAAAPVAEPPAAVAPPSDPPVLPVAEPPVDGQPTTSNANTEGN